MSERLPQLDKREAIGVIIVLSIGFTALASTFEVDVLADVFAIVGFVVLLPLVGILGDRLPFVAAEEDDAAESTTASGGLGEPSEPDDRDEQLATLRERYARGEIDEAEFERRVEDLLETEDGDTARDTDREGVTGHEYATDRDQSVEPE